MSKNSFRYLNFNYWIRKFSFSYIFQKLFFFSNTVKRKVVFNSIYKSYHWRDYHKPKKGESVSGLGSDLNRCESLVVSLNNFIIDENISSILDLACGDFIWMKNIVNSNNIKSYYGLDIVDELINNNVKLYSNNNIKFKACDVLSIDIPKDFELIMLRDFFIHIKNKEIMSILEKIKKTNTKYLAINNFPNVAQNKDIKFFGQHRDINLSISPFMLDKPYLIFKDNDRYMNIYKN